MENPRNRQKRLNFKNGSKASANRGSALLIFYYQLIVMRFLSFIRLEILSKRRERQQRRLELTKRKSAAAQERMRILSMLAKSGSTGPGKKKEDTFGMKDEDWDIYKTVSKVCCANLVTQFY